MCGKGNYIAFDKQGREGWKKKTSFPLKFCRHVHIKADNNLLYIIKINDFMVQPLTFEPKHKVIKYNM
jgi:hypothetical protein